MSALRNIRMMVRYTAWANRTLYDTLAKLPPEVPAAKGERGFGSMIYTLNHSYVVDLIWRGHLEGKPHGFKIRNTETMPSFAELREAQAASDAWYIGYADALSEAASDEIVHFNFVDGGPGRMTRGDMLLHIVNHKTYHRGFVAEMIYQVPGGKGPSIDLPVFLRDVPFTLP